MVTAIFAFLLFVTRRKQLKQMMEHATQFPEEYSKVASVQRKVCACALPSLLTLPAT